MSANELQSHMAQQWEHAIQHAGRAWPVQAHTNVYKRLHVVISRRDDGRNRIQTV